MTTSSVDDPPALSVAVTRNARVAGPLTPSTAVQASSGSRIVAAGPPICSQENRNGWPSAAVEPEASRTLLRTDAPAMGGGASFGPFPDVVERRLHGAHPHAGDELPPHRTDVPEVGAELAVVAEASAVVVE
jgi:hypothetical protein